MFRCNIVSAIHQDISVARRGLNTIEMGYKIRPKKAPKEDCLRLIADIIKDVYKELTPILVVISDLKPFQGGVRKLFYDGLTRLTQKQGDLYEKTTIESLKDIQDVLNGTWHAINCIKDHDQLNIIGAAIKAIRGIICAGKQAIEALPKLGQHEQE